MHFRGKLCMSDCTGLKKYTVELFMHSSTGRSWNRNICWMEIYSSSHGKTSSHRKWSGAFVLLYRVDFFVVYTFVIKAFDYVLSQPGNARRVFFSIYSRSFPFLSCAIIMAVGERHHATAIWNWLCGCAKNGVALQPLPKQGFLLPKLPSECGQSGCN